MTAAVAVEWTDGSPDPESTPRFWIAEVSGTQTGLSMVVPDGDRGFVPALQWLTRPPSSVPVVTVHRYHPPSDVQVHRFARDLKRLRGAHA